VGAAAALVAAQVAFAAAPLVNPGPPELLAVLGVLLVCAVVAAVAVPLTDAPLLLAPGLLGAVLVTGGAAAAGLDAAATPVESLAWGAAGVAFATLLDTPWLAVGLPLFVGAVDVAMWWEAVVTPVRPAPGDVLVLTLPDAAGRLGAPDAVFLGAFACYARRYGLREGAALGGMAAGLIAAVLLTLPSLALLAAGALVPNADRLPALLRTPRAG
jgi:hypothetical protein